MHRRQVRIWCPSVAGDGETVSQVNSSSRDSMEVISVGRAEFEEDMRDGEGRSDCTVSDFTE